MKVFVTGATGFIGSVVVNELQSAGHTVVGLARNDAGIETLTKAGAEVHRGDLLDIESLVAGVNASEGVIHLAFVHEFAKHLENVETDRKAVAAMLYALEGTGKPFVLTSGTALLPPGHLATENDNPVPGVPRSESEVLAQQYATRGVRTSIVRLSPSVHGAGDHGFVPMLISLAKSKGLAAYIGDGANRWPAVHRVDAAKLFRLALENGTAGSRFHGAAEEGVPMHAIAEAIGAGLGVPVRSLSADEGADHFGWFARFVGIDNPTSSAITRETLGWNPTSLDLLVDVRESGYFA